MNTDHYIALIYKDLAKQLSATERKELRAWEAASRANKARAKDIRKAWKLSEMPNENLPFAVNMDSEFAQIEAKINTKNKAQKATNIVQLHPRRRWLSVAAAVAILVIGVVLMQQYLVPNTDENVAWKTIISGTKTQNVSLPDGTLVTLRAGSELAYPYEFSDKKRSVKLMGEAFFKVAKDKNRPFTVTTAETTVTVLGTQFNVRALPNKSETKVSVQEGKVQFEANSTAQKVILTQQETGTYQHAQKTLAEHTDKGLNDLAWQRERFSFKDMYLVDALQIVKDYYKLNIELVNANLNTCQYNARPKTTDKIEDILTDIADHYGGKLVILDAKNYRILGGQCVKER